MTDTTAADTQMAESVAALTEQVATLAAAVERLGGYAPPEEWTWVECDGEGIWASLAPRDGGEPLRIECRADLLIHQVEAIDLGETTPIRDNWPLLARCIRAWNVKAENLASGEWEDVAPPSVIGPDAFKYVRPLASVWMAFVLKYATMRVANLPKKSGNSNTTPSPPNGPASASSSPAKPSRRNRTDTT